MVDYLGDRRVGDLDDSRDMDGADRCCNNVLHQNRHCYNPGADSVLHVVGPSTGGSKVR